MTETLQSELDRACIWLRGVRFVLATFCRGTMLRLRITAIASNPAFISYAAAANIRPVLILHSILLPVDVVRIVRTGLVRRTAGGWLNESVTGRSGTRDTHSASRALAAAMSTLTDVFVPNSNGFWFPFEARSSSRLARLDAS
jgi:hypothetical protein